MSAMRWSHLISMLVLTSNLFHCVVLTAAGTVCLPQVFQSVYFGYLNTKLLFPFRSSPVFLFHMLFSFFPLLSSPPLFPLSSPGFTPFSCPASLFPFLCPCLPPVLIPLLSCLASFYIYCFL